MTAKENDPTYGPLRLPCSEPNCRLWDGHPEPHRTPWRDGVSFAFYTARPAEGDDE